MYFPELNRNEQNSLKMSSAFLLGLFRRIFLKRKRKVFIIGFHKTGTSTLGKALQILGYTVCGSLKEAYDYDLNKDVKSYILEKAKPLLNTYDSFQDTPWFLIYKELYQLYPDAYFILTKRSEKRWIKSVQKHFGDQKFKYHDYIYGTNNSIKDESIYLKRYQNHNLEVELFFEGKSNFLIFDIENSNWETLVSFLGARKPLVAFPHANKAGNNLLLKTKVKSLIKQLYYKK